MRLWKEIMHEAKSCRFGPWRPTIAQLVPWRWALNKTTRWTWLLRLRPCARKFVVFAPKTSTQSNKSGGGVKFKWIQQKVAPKSTSLKDISTTSLEPLEPKQAITWCFLIYFCILLWYIKWGVEKFVFSCEAKSCVWPNVGTVIGEMNVWGVI